MEVLVNTKGGQKVTINGFMYNKHRPSNTHMYWRCVRHNFGCKGRLKANFDNTNPELVTDHDHDPDQRKVQITKARAEMKRKASTFGSKPGQILAQITATVPPEAQAFLPDAEVCKRTMRNARSKNMPAEPDNIQDLVIDAHFRQTLNENNAGERNFLLFDNYSMTGNRIVCFGSRFQIEQLANADKWFIDGNFKMQPRLFLQLYFIRVPVGNKHILTISALLESKSQVTYDDLFRRIVNICQDDIGIIPSPNMIMMDFEKSVVNAIQNHLGYEVVIKGCFYHLTQSTLRKIQNLGLMDMYNNDEQFRHFCGMLGKGVL